MKKAVIFSILVILVLVALGCAKAPEAPSEEREEFVDTGILVVESTPSEADVYVDAKLEGATPLTLYNKPVGYYNIKVRKEGYNDFDKIAAVKAGVTEEIDARLSPIQKDQPKQEAEQQEEQKQEAVQTSAVNMSSFAMYHDFDNKLFTELRSGTSDVFSRKYDTYVDFVVMSPAKIEIIEKPFKEVNKADCINTDEGVAQLKPQQTLCVITAEGNFFAASLKTINELEYVLLS